MLECALAFSFRSLNTAIFTRLVPVDISVSQKVNLHAFQARYSQAESIPSGSSSPWATKTTITKVLEATGIKYVKKQASQKFCYQLMMSTY